MMAGLLMVLALASPSPTPRPPTDFGNFGTPHIVAVPHSPHQKARDMVEWHFVTCETFKLDGTPHYQAGPCAQPTKSPTPRKGH
jgi:hypothetical protein